MFTMLLGLIFLFICPPVGIFLLIFGVICLVAKNQRNNRRVKKGIPNKYEKICSSCKELVRKDAEKCRFCGNENFDEQPSWFERNFF